MNYSNTFIDLRYGIPVSMPEYLAYGILVYDERCCVKKVPISNQQQIKPLKIIFPLLPSLFMHLFY